jgi:RNA polymerase sigma factor (sigma-70 family)
MASQCDSATIFELQSNANQFREWNANEPDVDFVSHAKRAAATALERELTETQRLYYIAYYLNGISMPEIADMYGVNKSTVSRTLTRATLRMARVLRYSAPHLLNQNADTKNRRVKDGK